jgi:hypothetical protein
LIGLIVEFELSELISDHVVSFLVEFLELIDLLQLFPHIIHDNSRLISFFLLFIGTAFIVLPINQFLKVLVSKAFNQVELVFEDDDAVVGILI